MKEEKTSSFKELETLEGNTVLKRHTEEVEAIYRSIGLLCGLELINFNKYLAAVNPVASSAHFNFSAQESMGVVSVIASNDNGLLGLVSTIAPIILSGNTCIVIAGKNHPLSAISFAEVLNASDVPGGVVNILTGDKAELIPHIAKHMDVNAVWYCADDNKELTALLLMIGVNLTAKILTRSQISLKLRLLGIQ